MGATEVSGAPSRLLRLSGALLGVAVVWFAVNMVHPVGPPALLWASIPAGAVVLTAVFLRTARSELLPPPTRRFWRHLSVAAVLVGVASTAQAVDIVATPDVGGLRTPPLMLICDAAAMLLIIYALYRLPFGKQTVGELVRMILDAGTVMLATAVFLWHFQTRQLLGVKSNAALVASLVLTVLALLAVFAIAKVMLSGYTFIDRKGLRLIALAISIGALAPTVQPAVALIDPRLYPMQVAIPAVFFFAAWAGEQQRHATFVRRRGEPEPRKRPFSVLPYLAVAAVDGLLIHVSFVDHSDEPVIVGAAVLVTAIVVLRQITAFQENGRLLRRLNHGANHDALTQLPNRVYFHKRLQKALTTPGDRPVAVALIDLDDFKEVNDTLGHEVGDLLLIAVAERLHACVRVEDTVARLGGDEFVVVLDGADPAAADLAAERMMEALRRPVVADGHELPIRASIGIADGRTGDEASMLLRHADIAMYAAKNLPGTACLHYDDGMAGPATEHAYLGAELREAIGNGELFLLYQPIVGLDDGRVMGAEALVRWAHPAHGTLAPDAFIPVAERSGLIVPLGRWVMRTAFRQLGTWIGEQGDAAPGVLNVNVSARELRAAITNGDLFLLYQPIVGLDDGRVVGAEALVRWAHPTHGTLTPDAFIPLAERTGLIVPLGRWVMRTAFAQLATWMAEQGDAAPSVLNVNVSARDLREPDLAAEVGALLAETGVDPSRITLEITETVALEDGRALTTCEELRALGVRVSLDDFGTGYSSLGNLRRLPVQ